MTKTQAVWAYELVHRLSAGIAGGVWLGCRMDIDAHSAHRLFTNPDCVGQLRREGTVAFSMRHPDLIGLHHIGARNDGEAAG
ncbi:MAG: hypothetical protein FJ290_20720 [Planctomycetes bacterium]|nr:hypothetical protein [Planctomycetota bacterium]